MQDATKSNISMPQDGTDPKQNDKNEPIGQQGTPPHKNNSDKDHSDSEHATTSDKGLLDGNDSCQNNDGHNSSKNIPSVSPGTEVGNTETLQAECNPSLEIRSTVPSPSQDTEIDVKAEFSNDDKKLISTSEASVNVLDVKKENITFDDESKYKFDIKPVCCKKNIEDFINSSEFKAKLTEVIKCIYFYCFIPTSMDNISG